MHWLLTTLALARQALREAGVEHALTGGLALSRWGVYRPTVDVDLLIDSSRKATARHALQDAGFELIAETPTALHFDGPSSPLVLLLADESTRDMLANTVMLDLLDARCVRAEDLIGLKLRAMLDDPRRAVQEKADIADLIKVNPNLDWSLIQSHAERCHQWPAIDAIRQKECKEESPSTFKKN